MVSSESPRAVRSSAASFQGGTFVDHWKWSWRDASLWLVDSDLLDMPWSGGFLDEKPGKKGRVKEQFAGELLGKLLISQLPSSNVDFLQFLSQIHLRNWWRGEPENLGGRDSPWSKGGSEGLFSFSSISCPTLQFYLDFRICQVFFCRNPVSNWNPFSVDIIGPPWECTTE